MFSELIYITHGNMRESVRSQGTEEEGERNENYRAIKR